MNNNNYKIIGPLFISIFTFINIQAKEIINNHNNLDSLQPKINGKNVELFRIDEKENLKVLLFYRPEKNEIFNYKLKSKISTSENSLSTEYNDFKTTWESILYFKQKVINIDTFYNITYIIKFDSVIVRTSISSADTSSYEYYNSVTRHQYRNDDDYLLYNIISKEEFTLKVSQNGDILEIMGLTENIINSLNRNTGLLFNLQKNIESILKQQFLYTPSEEITIGSTWKRIEDSEFLIFPIRKNLFYTLKGVKKMQNNDITFITEEFNADFLEKEQNENNYLIKLTVSYYGGEGLIQFNISRGCLEKVESKNSVFLNMNIYSHFGDGISRQRIEEEFLLERIE